MRARLAPGVHILPASAVRDFLGGRISSPGDPRNSGIDGTGHNMYGATPWRLPRLLYKSVGIFHTIVDAPADDIWSQGWEVITDEPKLNDELREIDARCRIKTALRQATIFARRDGRAIVRLFLHDNTGDPRDEPAGVRGVVRAQALTRDTIAGIVYDDDPSSTVPHHLRTGAPVAYRLRTNPTGDRDALSAGGVARMFQSKEVLVHADRILLVVMNPKEDDEYDGDSCLSWILPDGHTFENIKWAAGESYFQRASPLIQVKIDKDIAPPTDGEIDDIAAKVEKLQNFTAQKVIAEGFEISPVLGAERINPPDSYAKMFMEQFAAGARIPQRELVGDPGGALAAASWDVKRYFARIGNDREDFAAPLVRSWYERLDKWGIKPGLMLLVKGVHWYSHIELTEMERADVLVKVSQSVATFRTAQVPIPDEVSKLITWPEDFDPHEIVTPPAPMLGPGMAGGWPAPPALANAKPATDKRIEVSPELRRIEDRLESDLRAAYKHWRRDVEQKIERLSHVKVSLLDRAKGVRRDAEPDDVQRALLQVTLDPTLLDELLQEALAEAAALGQMKTWAQLGREGKSREFVKTRWNVPIVEWSRQFSKRKAAQLMGELQDAVGDVIADGGSVAEVKAAMRDRFGVLENEAVIARTESMRGWNQGAAAAMEEAGVQTFEFAAYAGADDGNPDGPCNVRDGQVFALTDTQNMPPIHPNCRCGIVPVIPEAA